jgi:N-ethylmaleimide reductase
MILVSRLARHAPTVSSLRVKSLIFRIVRCSNTAMAPTLLSPVTVGTLECPNRVVLSPMTRGRCGASGLVNADVVEYYTQRTSAGLIVTEGASISLQAEGWWGAPKMYCPEDATGWKTVTDAVHANGGRIYCQLWHSGRASHSVFRPDAADGRGVAPSPIMNEGHQFAFTPKGRVSPETPRELTTEEVDAVPQPRPQRKPALTAWSCTARMGTSWTPSCRA